ncbi:MAG: HEAT repeat domain-containing protein [Bradyrhizobium sp.]|nr:HEAT repeat domain-containing protein [Bradyrhizobium sp.]
MQILSREDLFFFWVYLILGPIIVLPYVFFIWAMWNDHAARTVTRDLKTFAAMKRAFRWGSKTSHSDNRRPAAIYAMIEFAQKEADAAQRAEIALLMRGAISKAMEKTDHRHVSQMLAAVAAAAPSWEADFLEQVVCSRLDGGERLGAIERFAKLRGRASLEVLLQLADDAPVAHVVAGAIGRLGKQAATPEVLSRLERMLDETQNQLVPSAAARALISFGEAASPVLVRNLKKFDPWTAFTVRVKTAGIDAAALIEQLFRSGVLDDYRRSLIKPSMISKMQKTLDMGDGFEAVTKFLWRVRAVYSFDYERYPAPDYAVLLRRLSRIGSSRVAITAINVQMDGEACREVNCLVAGQPARFSPRYMGYCVDLEALLIGLNEGLAAAGIPERFANLSNEDPIAFVIVGHDAGLMKLVETFGLPLDVGHAPIVGGMGTEQFSAAQTMMHD